jgi:hypothetical protein
MGKNPSNRQIKKGDQTLRNMRSTRSSLTRRRLFDQSKRGVTVLFASQVGVSTAVEFCSVLMA